MEAIKTSENVEFDVIYADGTRKHVAEGILIEAEGYRLTLHCGTSRASVVFATGEALAVAIVAMKASLKLKRRYLFRIAKVLFKRKGGQKNGV